jgi:hypothetical protein
MLHSVVKTEGTNISYDVIIEMRMDYLQIMKYITLLPSIIQIWHFYTFFFECTQQYVERKPLIMHCIKLQYTCVSQIWNSLEILFTVYSLNVQMLTITWCCKLNEDHCLTNRHHKNFWTYTSVSLSLRELHQLHRLNGVTCGWLCCKLWTGKMQEENIVGYLKVM